MLRRHDSDRLNLTRKGWTSLWFSCLRSERIGTGVPREGCGVQTRSTPVHVTCPWTKMIGHWRRLVGIWNCVYICPMMVWRGSPKLGTFGTPPTKKAPWSQMLNALPVRKPLLQWVDWLCGVSAHAVEAPSANSKAADAQRCSGLQASLGRVFMDLSGSMSHTLHGRESEAGYGAPPMST